MAIGSNTAALRQLRSAFAGGTVAGLSDAQLLERFASRAGGEASASAFAALVERHGAMVVRVCRATLRDEHDVQDAFQAVFLTLARKAQTLWVRDSLGPWLHGVSVRAAARIRVANARRRLHERRQAEPAVATDAPAGDDGIIPLIHEEIDRLPGHYRSALVLCDLQGLTHEQAARQLGWPVGTVKSRQARGRERLRGRLVRRGLAPASALAVLATAGPASAAVPIAWADAAVSASLGVVARGGAGSALAAVRNALRTPAWAQTGRFALAFAALVGASAGFQRLLPGTVRPPVRDDAAQPRPIHHLPAPDLSDLPTLHGPEGPAFSVRLAADAAHDADAARRALRSRDPDHPPDGYRWLPLGEEAIDDRDGLILRDAVVAGTARGDRTPSKLVLIRDRPEGVTERHLVGLATIGGRRRVSLRFSDEGLARFAGLADARLRDDGGATASRLAVVVAGEVVATPAIRRGVRDSLVLGLRRDAKPVLSAGHLDRLEAIRQGNARWSREAPWGVKEREWPPTYVWKPVGTPPSFVIDDDPIRRACLDEVAALRMADRVVLTAAGRDGVVVLDGPDGISGLIGGLRPHESTGPRGRPIATAAFERGGAVLRTMLVFEGRECVILGQPGWLAFEMNTDLRQFFLSSRAAPGHGE